MLYFLSISCHIYNENYSNVFPFGSVFFGTARVGFVFDAVLPVPPFGLHGIFGPIVAIGFACMGRSDLAGRLSVLHAGSTSVALWAAGAIGAGGFWGGQEAKSTHRRRHATILRAWIARGTSHQLKPRWVARISSAWLIPAPSRHG